VSVERVHLALLPPLARCELDPTPAPETLGLLRDSDLGTEVAKRALEEGALSGCARDDHPLDAGPREPCHLVRDERSAGDVDERLGPSAGSVAEPLGLAAGEDDRLQAAQASSWWSRSAVSGRTSVGELLRPMP